MNSVAPAPQPAPSNTHGNLQSPPQAGPTHPPPSTGGPSSVSTSPYVSPPAPAPALPVTTQSLPPTTSASALGGGAPSDWEYLGATSQEVDDINSFNKKQEQSLVNSTVELPSNHSRLESQPHQSEVPHHVSPIQDIAGLAGETSHTNEVPGRHTPVRNDSLTSSIVSPSEESTNFDGIIQMWSQPLNDNSKKPSGTVQEDSKLPQQARVGTPTNNRVQSPSHQSPQSASRNEPSTPQQIVKIVDPHEDLDPWYKSSLTRYVTMLRKEMAAESDEERFRIFTRFLTKETKLREILYGVEAEAPETGDDVVSYSPGGRPILGSALGSTKDKNRSESASEGLHRTKSNPIPPLQIRNQQANVGTNGATGILSPVDDVAARTRSTSVPPGVNSIPPPHPSNPGRPVYTPFRYAEGPQRGSSPLDIQRPAYQAYSALRQASADSGRTMAQPSAPTPHPEAGSTSTQAREEHDETFLGLIREKSVAYRQRSPSAALPPPIESLLPGAANAIFDELRKLIPAPLPSTSGTSQTVESRKKLEKFTDNFDFIEKFFEEWDRDSGDRRTKLESQRGVRQEESEQHIDSLFNDKEIGYSDINVLEDEFKQTEAQKQLTEERRECEDYVKKVFNPINERLNNEIAQVQTQYERALEFLNVEKQKSAEKKDSKASSDNLKMEKFQLSHNMKFAIDAFQKLELRYQKQLEASLERDRRRRKAERRYYVFLGDTIALKQLERDFDTAEKRNNLEAAKKRDDRANRLMDSFDEASMRGLGENQRRLDDIFARVKKLDTATIKSMGKLPSSTEQTVKSASAFVEFLGADSESILSSFGIADRVLNDADYDVSVSEAKVANAKAEIFRRLETEKKKEDQKIEDDLQSRMESVKKGHQAILTNLQEVLDSMRKAGFLPSSVSTAVVTPPPPITVSPPPDPSSPPEPANGNNTSANAGANNSNGPMGDPQQQERLRKALEDAKKRNAAKASSGEL